MTGAFVLAISLAHWYRYFICKSCLSALNPLTLSSLTNANATLATAGKPVTQDKVVELAQVYERYVLGLGSTPQAIKEPESIAEMASDIPF